MLKRALLLMGLAAGCVPSLDDSSTIVSGPRLLAVAQEPAEAAPGSAVTWRALDVTPEGPSARPLDWAFCQLRKPVSEAGALNPSCLVPSPSPALDAIGLGSPVTARIPNRVCQVFGPETPTPRPGEPATRAADPDSTGGFYQPLRVRLGDQEAYASYDSRVRCALGSVTPEQQSEFDKRSRLNVNPALVGLELVGGPSAVTAVPSLESDATARTIVPAGAPVTLRLTWQACPVSDVCGDGVCGLDETATACPGDCQTPRGCGGAEPYLWFDPQRRVLSVRREVMRASWFTTAGALVTGTTGRSEEQWTLSTSENTWTPPAAAGVQVRFWVVLRDDRGGATWASYLFETR